MESLLNLLRKDYSDFKFVEDIVCHWSPETQTVFFTGDHMPEAKWGMLHELGHALLGHTTYKTDAELLQKEMLAWERARVLAKKYNITLDEDHIQGCLDSYRDWINKRSTCPACGTKTVSTAANEYQCFNCEASWQVSPARYYRPYRRQIPKTART